MSTDFGLRGLLGRFKKQAIYQILRRSGQAKKLRMETYDAAPLSFRAVRFGPIVSESDADGMTSNHVGPLAAGKTMEGSHLEENNNLP